VPRVPAPEIEAIVLKALREANESAEKDLSERELVHERLAILGRPFSCLGSRCVHPALPRAIL
jgi:hypothetical protein